MRRTQIYLSESQQTALASLARGRGTTASALIRDAIDGYLAAQLSPTERLDALRQFASRVAAGRVVQTEDSAALVESLRAVDRDRLDSPA